MAKKVKKSKKANIIQKVDRRIAKTKVAFEGKKHLVSKKKGPTKSKFQGVSDFDEALMHLSPALQGKVNTLLKTIESGPQKLYDLQALGLSILKRAMAASEDLKKTAVKTSKKIMRKV